MSDYRLNGLLWAIGLVASGVLILLFNFDVLGGDPPVARYGLAAAMALGGLGFFAAFLASRHNWWRLIPGWTLLALAGMVYIGTLANASPTLTAALLFLGLALAFGHVYLLRRDEHWWAIIPGGFMLVLGLVIVLSDILPLQMLGALLFAGMGLVFCLLYLLGDRRRQWWTLIPGAVLLIFGLFVLAQDGEGSNPLIRWWPLLLVLLGLGIGWRQTRPSPAEKLTVNTAPRPASVPHSATSAPLLPERGTLGEYTHPAPGASVEVLPDPNDEQDHVTPR
jgi:drug/metabolite transporter (DMT)-like permease